MQAIRDYRFATDIDYLITKSNVLLFGVLHNFKLDLLRWMSLWYSEAVTWVLYVGTYDRNMCSAVGWCYGDYESSDLVLRWLWVQWGGVTVTMGAAGWCYGDYGYYGCHVVVLRWLWVQRGGVTVVMGAVTWCNGDYGCSGVVLWWLWVQWRGVTVVMDAVGWCYGGYGCSDVVLRWLWVQWRGVTVAMGAAGQQPTIPLHSSLVNPSVAAIPAVL